MPIGSAPKDTIGILVCRRTWVRARVATWSHGTWWTNSEPLTGDPDLWMPLPEVPREA